MYDFICTSMYTPVWFYSSISWPSQPVVCSETNNGLPFNVPFFCHTLYSIVVEFLFLHIHEHSTAEEHLFSSIVQLLMEIISCTMYFMQIVSFTFECRSLMLSTGVTAHSESWRWLIHK